MSSYTLGFLGAGHLNQALISGLLQQKSETPTHQQSALPQIIATCKSPENADKVSSHYKIKCTTNNRWLIEQADFIVLGVKPQQMKEVLEMLGEYDLGDKILISVAAGITLEQYRLILDDDVRLIRAMPNIAASKQAALTGIYSDIELSEEEMERIEALFGAVGGVEWLEDETQLDGILALSGSGIGFVFRMMQAMAKAGERYGFEEDALYDIIAQTVFGAGVLALENEQETPRFQDFIRQIARKGGTTEAGLSALDTQIDRLMEEAFGATVARNQALGEELTRDWGTRS
ncbi:MAG: pyrroline-5-carboxylate reductase [Cardiobacteriaceae bacterium]|nr:pyrroline-5-carboxylate reductase [Cardiobacteriaceae bacterium]